MFCLYRLPSCPDLLVPWATPPSCSCGSPVPPPWQGSRNISPNCARSALYLLLARPANHQPLLLPEIQIYSTAAGKDRSLWKTWCRSSVPDSPPEKSLLKLIGLSFWTGPLRAESSSALFWEYFGSFSVQNIFWSRKETKLYSLCLEMCKSWFDPKLVGLKEDPGLSRAGPAPFSNSPPAPPQTCCSATLHRTYTITHKYTDLCV